MRMTLIPWLVLCCLHFTSNALSITPQLHIIPASFYLPLCCLGWNPILRPSLSNVLHITKPIYLRGHIHIFIHSHSHQALHQETLNQDSPFKQTNELWITPLHKLPAQSVTETERLGGWWGGGIKREREKMKNIREIEEQEQKGDERGDRGCETESNRGEDAKRREGEKQTGKRECVGLQGPWSRKRPLLHGSTLMGLARPRFVHTVGQPLRIKITK